MLIFWSGKLCFLFLSFFSHGMMDGAAVLVFRREVIRAWHANSVFGRQYSSNHSRVHLQVKLSASHRGKVGILSLSFTLSVACFACMCALVKNMYECVCVCFGKDQEPVFFPLFSSMVHESPSCATCLPVQGSWNGGTIATAGSGPRGFRGGERGRAKPCEWSHRSTR